MSEFMYMSMHKQTYAHGLCYILCVHLQYLTHGNKNN